jgi:hypothetical protein
MAEDIPPFPTIDRFLLSTPLYTKYKLDADLLAAKKLYKHPSDNSSLKIDGYCPFCKKDTTFSVSKAETTTTIADWGVKFAARQSFDRLQLHCARIYSHQIDYFLGLNALSIMKVGQSPSLADIAIDETRQKFRTVLKGENWSEFYKAIGLAAHGEGIGSFVYLRRVFERLIYSRFEEFKDIEGWKNDDFVDLHMDEKVAFLKGHLPPYLVEIRRIYSIFSKGIHQLENEACLQFFEIGKRSILIVLQEDLKRQQDLQDRKEMAAAVAQFSAPSQS